MRVLLIHNRYRQRGGEDTVFDAERRLLERHGVEVETLVFDNADIPEDLSVGERLSLAVGTVWSREGADRVRAVVRDFGPDVAHFHNTFPLVSPAAYRAARRQGAAVVQTLHNFRLICPSAVLLRDGAPCEACVGRPIAWPGIRFACYRDSRPETAVVAAMQTTHRALGTWRRHVDRYVALTEFARQRFIADGLPGELIEVKYNFVDPMPPPTSQERHGFLFFGRLEESKGVATLLEAWSRLPPTAELTVAGDGPLMGTVQAASRRQPNISVLGRVGRDRIFDELVRARALIFPSIWYEGCPMAILEAFATGTPTIASRLGAMTELITDGETGILFGVRDADDLASKVLWADTHPQAMRTIGHGASSVYETKFTSSTHHKRLMVIYERAIQRRCREGL